MTADFYLRHFTGFALQLVPGCVLLLLSFDGERLRKGRSFSYAMLIGEALLFSLIFPVVNHSSAFFHSNLGSNLYMHIAILAVALLYFYMIADSWLRKLAALLCVIVNAAVQYSLANILMNFLPFENQPEVYSTNTVISYIIVTAVSFPFIVLFFCRIFRPYLMNANIRYMTLDLVLLLGISILYIVILPVYSGLWQEAEDILGIGYGYYVPFVLLMTLLLSLTFYSLMKVSLVRSKESEQAMYNAITKQSYENIKHSMDKQREQLHDVRQLLASMSSITENGTREDIIRYISEATERTKRTDVRYCLDPCLNGILQYYAAILDSHDIPFTVKANCGKLPFDDVDLTILISNAMENAVRSALEYRGQTADGDTADGIRFTAGVIANEFAVQIENPCVFASISHPYKKSPGSFLPADAFVSATGGGIGLRRMEDITKTYDGGASFCFDSARHIFITRMTLSMLENGR